MLANRDNGGLLPAERGTAIIAAADEVLAGKHPGEFPLAIWQVEMRKCSSERWVCAPHSLSAGTSIGPIESFSADRIRHPKQHEHE